MALTSKEISQALTSKYSNYGRYEKYAIFPELRIGTGFSDSAEQRIDFFVLALTPSLKYEKIAFEIKVGRGDFLKEIKNPVKRRQALLFSNRFYFVAPKGLIKIEELPIECGLMEVEEKENGVRHWKTIHTRVQAPWRDEHLPNWGFVSSLARRVAREEKLQYMCGSPLCPNCYQPFKNQKTMWDCPECEIQVSK